MSGIEIAIREPIRIWQSLFWILEFLDTVSLPAWPKTCFGEDDVLTQDWVNYRSFALSPGPLGATVWTCPAWLAAGILRVQVVIRWTLTKQSPSRSGGVCSSARRPTYLISLPGQLRPSHPAPFQGSRSQLGRSAWGGSQVFFPFHPFWFHRHFLLSLGSNCLVQHGKTNPKGRNWAGSAHGASFCCSEVKPKVTASLLQDRKPRSSLSFPQLLPAQGGYCIYLHVSGSLSGLMCRSLSTSVGFRIQVYKVHVWAWSFSQAAGFATHPAGPQSWPLAS